MRTSGWYLSMLCCPCDRTCTAALQAELWKPRVTVGLSSHSPSSSQSGARGTPLSRVSVWRLHTSHGWRPRKAKGQKILTQFDYGASALSVWVRCNLEYAKMATTWQKWTEKWLQRDRNGRVLWLCFFSLCSCSNRSRSEAFVELSLLYF